MAEDGPRPWPHPHPNVRIVKNGIPQHRLGQVGSTSARNTNTEQAATKYLYT